MDLYTKLVIFLVSLFFVSGWIYSMTTVACCMKLHREMCAQMKQLKKDLRKLTDSTAGRFASVDGRCHYASTLAENMIGRIADVQGKMNSTHTIEFNPSSQNGPLPVDELSSKLTRDLADILAPGESLYPQMSKMNPDKLV